MLMDYINQYLKLFSDPRGFFKSVGKEKIGTTLVKALPLVIILNILNSIPSIYFNEPLNSIFPKNILIPLFIGMVMIFIPISILIGSSILYISLRVLKVKAMFSQNIKILIYLSIVTGLISLIPSGLGLLTKSNFVYIGLSFVFGIALFVYCAILTSIAISEIYKTSIGRGVGAFFLALGLLIGAILLIFILILIIVLSFVGVASVAS